MIERPADGPYLSRWHSSRHYSCTCWRAERDRPTGQRIELARFDVGWQDGSRLLQTIDRQVLRHAQMRFVVALMDDAMGLEGLGRPFVVDAAGGEAATLAHKPEGRHRSQPGKPLRGIGHQREFAFLRTDHHILAVSSIFDQRKQRPCSLLRRVGTSLWPGLCLLFLRPQRLLELG